MINEARNESAQEVGFKIQEAARKLWDSINPRPTPQTHRWVDRGYRVDPTKWETIGTIDLVELATAKTVARLKVTIDYFDSEPNTIKVESFVGGIGVQL